MATSSAPTHSDGIPIELNNTPLVGPSTTNALPRDFYTSYISDFSKARMPSAIRGLFTVERTTPGLLSLLAGKPSAATFPITSVSINVRSQDPSTPNEQVTLTIDQESDRIVEALQYGQTAGHPDLNKWLCDLQTHLHGRRQDDSWRLTIGAGSQDLLYKAFWAITNPGDNVLIEAPVYAGVIPILRSIGANLVEVETDGGGIKSSSLRTILESWPSNKPLPKFLYTVPYGCNPTGATANLERRREVLALAREYKFLILEDDPYYMLYYGPEPRPSSYFALEAQNASPSCPTGLVLRFDSLSKVLSAGLRIGFTSGPSILLDAMDLHTTSSNLQAASLSQSVALALLSHWGIPGLETHVKFISEYYRERRDVFEKALNKHLGGMIEYTTPVSGMFLWFKLLIPSATAEDSEGDSAVLISTKAVERGVLALPGTSFFANGRQTAFVRASFSMLNDSATDEALRRLGEVVREAREA